MCRIVREHSDDSNNKPLQTIAIIMLGLAFILAVSTVVYLEGEGCRFWSREQVEGGDPPIKEADVKFYVFDITVVCLPPNNN
jgi:hypothetical protein